MKKNDNDDLTKLEFTIKIPSVSLDSLSNRFSTKRGRSGVKNSTLSSPSISESDGHENIAQQRINNNKTNFIENCKYNMHAGNKSNYG